MVMASLVIDNKANLAADIALSIDGLPEELLEPLRDAADEAFDSIPRPKRRDDEVVMEALRIAIRRAADSRWGKKPLCRVLLHRI
jgi:ribonuclease J